MIPPYLEGGTSSAERRVFEGLERIPAGDGRCCLHSVNLPDHIYKQCGELDFVVVGPRGLYVLEVKGGGISCREGIWQYENRWGEVTKSSEGPFHQARSGMYSLRERLLNWFSERELAQLVMGHGVILADCERFDVRGTEWPAEIVLDAHHWRSRGLAGYLGDLEAYWGDKHARRGDRVSEAPVAAIVQALRPDFELARSLRVRADEIDERIVRMTEEQYAQLDLIEECDRILTRGGAGTGKTFLAMEIARRDAATGRSVLFVCLSPLLAEYLARQVRNPLVRITSVHALMLDELRRRGRLPAGFLPARPIMDPWFTAELLPAFQRVAPTLDDEDRFDVLIVDEGQDILNLDYMTALEYMLRDGLERGKWRIFYDPFNQGAIFGGLDKEMADYLRGLANVPGVLKTNCRNTDEIVLQIKLTTGADLGNLSTGPGFQVEWKAYRDPQEAATLLGEHLTALRRRQIPEGQVTILSPVPFEASSVRHLPAALRGRIVPLDTTTAREFPGEHLTFATVDGFKGLENRFVALTDIEDLDSTPQAVANVYVGMSRARAGLWVAMHERLKDRHRELVLHHLGRMPEGGNYGARS